MTVIFAHLDRLISFASVHHAIRGERLLKEAGIQVVALPTPREIAISCGQCLLFAAKDENNLLELLEQQEVQWQKLFSRNTKENSYIKIGERE